MILPNTYFEGFPIEFKEINPTDFPEFEVENNNEKIIIEPNSSGYINDVFQEQISLLHKNTVVVNAAVGQGKSTAIIKTIKRYYENHPNTIIIVASPFVNLVEQYCNDINLKAGIPENQIYNYNLIGRSLDDYRTKRVHVITVNTLLGNPGEDAFRNSKNKRKYLNQLLEHCESNNIKVVFVYDEVHDAISNFKEEYIFSLWKWRDVILKNYILSATYNEASKIVIEYLAELTNKKIQIIESKRVVFPEKQSKLFLHFSPAYSFKSSNPELSKIVKDCIDSGREIDILSFSKKLVKEVIEDNTGIGKLLRDKFGELNDCTSELVSNHRMVDETPTNRYDSSKCNIGTNFKTGVSIEKENHALIIVMPSRSTRMEFKNQYGIFSGGINSIIQALARQRKTGEIHILLPNPDKFNYLSLDNAGFNNEQKRIFEESYDLVGHTPRNDDSKVEYIKLNAQDQLISRFYREELYGNVTDEITYIESLDRSNLAQLRYPSYKLFKLNRGEDYLARKFAFFGDDIAAYVTYCAITNQFVNCKLANMTYKPILRFKQGLLQRKLWHYFNIYFEDFKIAKNHITFSHFYSAVRSKFFNFFSLKMKSNDGYSTIRPFDKTFENQLLRFCAIEYFGRNYYYFERNRNTGDSEYTRGTYFLDCIAIANSVNLDEIRYPQQQKNKIIAYKKLGLLRELIIGKTRNYSRGNINYDFFPVKLSENFFSQEEKILIEQNVSLLIESDELIKNDIFNFKRNLLDASGREKPLQKKLESLYKMLIDDFFDITVLDDYPKINLDGIRTTVKPINRINQLPDHNYVIDTLRLDGLIQFANQHYGSFETYQNTINIALAEL